MEERPRVAHGPTRTPFYSTLLQQSTATCIISRPANKQISDLGRAKHSHLLLKHDLQLGGNIAFVKSNIVVLQPARCSLT